MQNENNKNETLKESKTSPWLDWAVKLQAIAQAGLTYGKDVYDRERYEQIRDIAAEMISLHSGISKEKVVDLFCGETGYQTPKLDTRAAVFQDGKILLVKENNGTWSLPGGWVDVDVSVHDNIIKEVKEEMYRRVADLPVDKEKIGELFDQVEIVPEHRIKAGADLIYIMSNYIVEIGLANIVQKQLMLEMKAKAELESLLQVTELKALQSQVNPHFLFNTLNTIARLALLEGAEKTQEVVYALADLLRNNLRDIDVLRTIEEEVKSTRDYLTIQKVRFGDRIASEIQIDAALLEGLIPALTLQPLVENAIIHGLENRVEGGRIFLEGQMENGDMVLTVRDTGVGMSAERLQSLFREERRQNSHGQTTGLGIINVHKRICHFFGEQYGLAVESVPGEGTSVRLRLPFRHN